MKSVAVAASAAIALLLPVTSVQAEEPIKIGFAIAESGWLSNYDSAPFKAAVMKIEEINKWQV